MIKLINVRKDYISPREPVVTALKDINIEFENTGMVFILGKSGCGKSTLLNVLGGLDTYEGGDLIINGKSTKNYRAKDFDDYRNNHVGFVFQEFNLLQNYTVERNLSLALELQSQKNVGKLVSEALKNVELEGYEKRKATALSGGQKQRVAIARAIIKNPDIILADEPSGSLDEETGKQVFELLKKLSKQRLVVIVTHDRESANIYGDRIIELSDGRIKSDTTITKPEEEAETSIKKENFKFRKSVLSLKNIFTLGASNLRKKTIRLLFTILLFALTITFFGFGIMSAFYNWDKATLEIYYKNDIDSLIITQDKNSPYYNEYSLFSTEELSLLETNNVDYDFFPMYSRGDFGYKNAIREIYNYYEQGSYYSLDNIKYSAIDEKLMDAFDFSIVAGRLPNNRTEVAIPIYLYHFFEYYYYLDPNILVGRTMISAYSHMLGRTITMPDSGIILTVVGIIDTNIEEEFMELKDLNSEMEYDDRASYALKNEKFNRHTSSYFHSALFVTHDYIDEYINGYYDLSAIMKYRTKIRAADYVKQGDKYVFNYQESSNDVILLAQSLKMAEHLKYNVTRVVGEGLLAKNEIIVPYSFLKSLVFNHKMEFSNLFDRYDENISENEINDFLNKGFEVDIQSSKLPIFNINEEESQKYVIVGYWESSGDSGAIKKYNRYEYIFMNDAHIYEVGEGDKSIISVVTNLTGDKKADLSLMKYILNNNSNDKNLSYKLGGPLSYDIEMASYISNEYKTLGIYGSVIFGIFSVLMMFNFIAISILNKKKEIGILRALGTKNKHIFLIFCTESFIISIISIIIGIAAFIIWTGYLQTKTLLEGYQFNLFSINPLTIIAMIALGLLITFVGCGIPLFRLMKKKPVDIIRNA